MPLQGLKTYSHISEEETNELLLEHCKAWEKSEDPFGYGPGDKTTGRVALWPNTAMAVSQCRNNMYQHRDGVDDSRFGVVAETTLEEVTGYAMTWIRANTRCMTLEQYESWYWDTDEVYRSLSSAERHDIHIYTQESQVAATKRVLKSLNGQVINLKSQIRNEKEELKNRVVKLVETKKQRTEERG